MTKDRHDCHFDRCGGTDEQEADDRGQQHCGFAQHHTHLVFASRNTDFTKFATGQEPKAPEDEENSRDNDGQLGGYLNSDKGGDDGTRNPDDFLGGGVQ